MVAFEMILGSIGAAFTWADSILTSSGYLPYFVGIILIKMIFDKLIRPVLRGSGSDRADRRRHGKGGSGENG